MTTPSRSDEFATQEVIRPAAVLSETAARAILSGLALDDVRSGGHWWARVGTWRRYQAPWAVGDVAPGEALHVGSISCVYDSPARYCVTVFRVSLTAYGLGLGWTTVSLCDDAFRHAGLTLAECPRASLSVPPPAYSEQRRDSGPPR